MLALAALLLAALGPAPAAAQSAFVTTWETTSSGESITIPTRGDGEGDPSSTPISRRDYNFRIDWGDGTTEQVTGDDPDPSHMYTAAGTYQVKIKASQAGEAFPRIYLEASFNGTGSSSNARMLQSIDQWGAIEWESMEAAFAGAENMTYRATDTPDLSSVANAARMFIGAEAFNGDLGSWDVSGVTNMSYMLASTTVFNQDLSTWDVSSVTDMSGMFSGADTFNQDLNSWDVSRVSDMNSMFQATESFNGDIDSWDVSSVTDMSDMFDGAISFNQDLGSWDVSSVDDSESTDDSFEEMFSGSDLSAENYDRTLIGWSRLDLLQGATLGASYYGPDIGYCDAGPFRTYLQNEFGWTIDDGGQATGCPSDLASGGSDAVSSDESVPLTTGTRVVFSGTRYTGSGGSGEVALGRFSEAPRNVGGIPESSVSSYRLVLVASPDLSFDGTTEVRVMASEFPGIPAPGEVTVYRRPVPGEGDFTALPTSYEASSGEIVAETGSAGEPGHLGELVFASGSNPLPVELARFEGAVIGNEGAAESAVRLRWATASEESNTGFQVQRRAEGGSWTDLQFVEGAGTTSEPQTYRFTDADLPYAADSLRYRLKQVDTDGTASLTDPITIGRGRPAGLELLGTAPNPASRQVTVRYGIPEATASETRGPARLRLYDLLGRQVRSIRLGGSGTVAGRHKRGLDVSGLAPGTYVLRLEAGGQAATRKVTVVR
jgi:surface protein